jgi:hypothetical protein
MPEGFDGDNAVIFSGEYEAVTESGDTIRLNYNGDTDPFIAYGIAVVDLGAPSTFGFIFATPIVPTGPMTVVSGSLVGGLTDATGDGVSITPFGQPTVQESSVGFPLTNMGVGVGGAFASGPGAPGALYAYGPHASGTIAGPTGPWTFLQINTSFTLSGGGDAAALTGFASVETAPPVPEPASLSLLGMGALGLLRRRRAARK